MIELRVESQLQRLAPPLLGGGSTYFNEEDLQAAFSTGKSTDKAVDAGIDFGGATMLAEIVSAQVTVATREEADVDAFKKDIERMVLKKVRQLDVTAKNLLRNPQSAARKVSASRYGQADLSSRRAGRRVSCQPADSSLR